MISDKKRSRIAGLVFLALIALGVFAEFYVRQNIYVFNNAEATAANISASPKLFSLGFVSDILMAVAFLFFALLLYPIVKKIQRNSARLMLISVSIAATLLCLTSLNLVGALLLLNGEAYLTAFSQAQLNILATFFLKLHSNGYMIAQVFYGLYLFPLGFIIFKSGLLPKVIGVLLMLGCIGDFIDFFRFFLFPEIDSLLLQNITLPADLGEFSMCLWLLIAGVRQINKA